MSERRSALFLERQNYRRRRLTDTMRVVPLVGALLWLVPLLWPTEGEKLVTTSSAIIYLFGVWILLVIVSAVLSRLLHSAATEDSLGDR